ncbi:hypothetical protein [Sinomonas sp. B1-1]|uniref:hypothetical protein n=1 Tax=Sinomonas TaxID=596707 RepID=UPI003D28EE1E
MSFKILFSSLRGKRRRRRPPALRRLELLWLRVCRAGRGPGMCVALFGGWVWFAAGSLIGFEAFDIVFGTFALAPELLKLVILGLPLTWYSRGHSIGPP